MYYAHMIGKIGEDVAAKYLKQKGYRILERNFRSKLRRNRYNCTR